MGPDVIGYAVHVDGDWIVVGPGARCCSAGDLDTAVELPVHHLGEDVVITARL
jgi:hypothetical protein